MLTDSERTDREREIREEWLALMDRIHRANDNLTERAERGGVRVELDEHDTLRISIGPRPTMVYSQRAGRVTLHLDSATDEIIGFQIDDVSTYHARQAAIGDLLPALRRLGELQLPPKSRGAERMGHDLTELVPA